MVMALNEADMAASPMVKYSSRRDLQWQAYGRVLATTIVGEVVLVLLESRTKTTGQIHPVTNRADFFFLFVPKFFPLL